VEDSRVTARVCSRGANTRLHTPSTHTGYTHKHTLSCVCSRDANTRLHTHERVTQLHTHTHVCVCVAGYMRPSPSTCVRLRVRDVRAIRDTRIRVCPRRIPRGCTRAGCTRWNVDELDAFHVFLYIYMYIYISAGIATLKETSPAPPHPFPISRRRQGRRHPPNHMIFQISHPII
jgi:hypothetical protein